MQRRTFLSFGLASFALLSPLHFAFSAQQPLKNNTALIKSLEKHLGFPIIRFEQKPSGLFYAVLANGDFSFVLYSKDTDRWYPAPHFS